MRHHLSALVLLATAALLTGCGSTGDDHRLTISVATFGDFGYESLFREYESLHPEIKLVSRITEFEEHHTKLATQLATGRGAADVVAIEEGYLPQLRQSSSKFVDLADLGALSLREQYTPWKWEQGLADSGRTVLGLGTDMGSLALCYRKDYFAAAGLPTDRTEVGALWPTWEAYAEVAKRFSTTKPDVGFVDTAASIYTSMLNQAEEGYFSRADDSFIGDRNPRVRAAFDLAGKLAEEGRTARLTPYSQEWTVAIRQGSFATVPCPAWMLALLRNAGGDENKGRWDVTSVPGGGGNQGGSFLAVPAQGKHTAQAYDVAKFLTAPEQQKRIFLETGNLPSEPQVYRSPEVLSKTDHYFSDAPIGSIYAKTADALRPAYRGVRDFLVRPKFTAALNRVETGRQSIADAWQQAMSETRGDLK
ncbi:extracellular solute-binding protein [Lentzea sp. NPDC004782]|uniref:ABC transporter substrate-binding protein n=1 Tax=Lentzea sp. NPDC004782 TaxID=3154458 RepID=UPI0033BBB129